MKVAFASSLVLALPSALALSKVTPFRQLNDQAAADGADDYEFLQSYEQVYVSCNADTQVANADGTTEYGAVVYRLCPSGTACSEKGGVCKSGYGDYVVGMQTYMERFMQQFKRSQEQNGDNANGNDGQFNMEEFGECGQLNVEAADADDANQVTYFVGPMCDNGDIRLALFASYDGDANACIPANESKDVSFYDLTGVELPWSTSLMEDDKCKAYYCYGYNDNNEAEYNEFCTALYENAYMKCEANMATYSPNGQVVTNCEEISAMLPSSRKKGGAGWFIFALLVAAVAGFGVWYFLQQKKKSAVSQEGLMM
ncbi:hypothetical protein ACA910_015582 [Epithemia clementina (nom. ined.)]